MSDPVAQLARRFGESVDEIRAVLADYARAFGMTADEMAAHLVHGDIRHPEAPATDCGATDPRPEHADRWCRLPPRHRGTEHDAYPEIRDRYRHY